MKFLKLFGWLTGHDHDDIFPRIIAQQPYTQQRLPMLYHAPKGMRFFDESIEDCKMIAIEQPPEVRTVFCRNNQIGKKEIPQLDAIALQLKFPHTLFVFRYYISNLPKRSINFLNLSVCFSDTTIMSSSDIVHYLPLGNHTGDLVCLGDTYRKRFDNIPQMIDYLTDYYWRSIFSCILQQRKWLNLTQTNAPLTSLYCSNIPLFEIIRHLKKDTPAFEDYQLL